MLFSLKRDKANIQAAIKSFADAIELDPSFAKAYAGLADCYALKGNVLYGPMRAKDAMDRARYNAQQALDLDYSLPEAHTAMGVIKLKYDWDWAQAENEFKLALNLNPEYAPAHYWYSHLLVVQGNFDEAIKESVRARDLDPYSPLAAMNYGRALYFARRYQESADYFARLLEDKPDYPQFLHVRGLVLLQLNLNDEAIDTLKRLHQGDPMHAAAALGFAYGKSHKRAEALQMIQELDELEKHGPISPHEKAFVFTGIGDRDEAFRLLEKAYAERFEGLIYLTSDSIYDDLRVDPRFANLARRINLSL
jgi:serine/threonine-protein kinase